MLRISRSLFLGALRPSSRRCRSFAVLAGSSAIALVGTLGSAQAADIHTVLSSTAAGSYSAGYSTLRTDYLRLTGTNQSQAADQLSPAIYDALFDSIFSSREMLHDVIGRTSSQGTGARFQEGLPSALLPEWDDQDLASLHLWGEDIGGIESWSASLNPVYQLVGFDAVQNPATQVGVSSGICQDAFGSYPCTRGVVQGQAAPAVAPQPSQPGGGMVPYGSPYGYDYASMSGYGMLPMVAPLPMMPAPLYPMPGSVPGMMPGMLPGMVPGMLPGMVPGAMLGAQPLAMPSFPTNPALAPVVPTTGVAAAGASQAGAQPAGSRVIQQQAQTQAEVDQDPAATGSQQSGQQQSGQQQSGEQAPALLAPIQTQGQFQPLQQPDLPPAAQQAAPRPSARQAQQPRPSLLQRIMRPRGQERAVAGQSRQAFAGQDAATSVYVAPFYLNRQSDNQASTLGHDESGFGVLVGADHKWSPQLSAGLGASYVTSDIDSNYLNATGSLQGYGLSAYSHFEGQDLFFDVKATGNFTSASVKRNVSLPTGFTDSAKASPNMVSGGLSGKAGVSVLDMFGGERCLSCMAQDTDVRPYFGMTIQGARMDSFTEAASGGSSLQVEAETAWAVDYALGVSVDTNIALGPVMVVPNMDVAYHYDWQQDRSFAAAFTGQPSTGFTYDGRNLDGSSLGLGVGLDVISSGVVDGYLRYDGQYRIGGTENTTHVTSFGLRLNF